MYLRRKISTFCFFLMYPQMLAHPRKIRAQKIQKISIHLRLQLKKAEWKKITSQIHFTPSPKSTHYLASEESLVLEFGDGDATDAKTPLLPSDFNFLSCSTRS
jgi:hypothetical protein